MVPRPFPPPPHEGSGSETKAAALAGSLQLRPNYGGPGGRAMRRCLCANVDVTVDDVDVTIDDDDVTVDDDDVTHRRRCDVHARWIKITSGNTPRAGHAHIMDNTH